VLAGQHVQQTGTITAAGGRRVGRMSSAMVIIDSIGVDSGREVVVVAA